MMKTKPDKIKELTAKQERALLTPPAGHTPGPVHYVEVQDRKTGLIGYEVRFEDESVMCEIKPKPYPVHVREENAAFIIKCVNRDEVFGELLEKVKEYRDGKERYGLNLNILNDLIRRAEGVL